MKMTTPPREWLDTMGAGVKVAVLDTGLSPTVRANIVHRESLTVRSIEEDPIHGTEMVRIIASNDPEDIGMAPMCEVYYWKVLDKSLSPWHRFARALDLALENGCQVVNMSFASHDQDPEMEAALKRLDAAGALLLAPWSDQYAFPHGYDSVIACGAIGMFAGAKRKPVLLTVNEVIRRGLGTKSRPLRGNSVSTAVMSGIAACAKAFNPGITREEFTAELLRRATS